MHSNFTNLLRITGLGLMLAVSSGAALAKGHATAQNHHCKLADGSMDMAKTKKQCLTAKGEWAKDGAAAASAPAPMAAPAAAPAAPAATPPKG